MLKFIRLKPTKSLFVRRSTYNKRIVYANKRIEMLHDTIKRSGDFAMLLLDKNDELKEKLAKYDRKRGPKGRFVKQS